jgi:hypothetical protein
MDPYEVLGVARDATAAEVRRAYVERARRFHPDHHLGSSATTRAEAERRMREVNDAWAVLRDPERRRRLDGERPAQPFRPFSPASDDEDDPRDAPDVPYRPAPAPTAVDRLATLGPVLLFAASVVVAAMAAFLRIGPALGLAAILFLLSCVGFLVVPLRALGRARQDEG